MKLCTPIRKSWLGFVLVTFVTLILFHHSVFSQQSNHMLVKQDEHLKQESKDNSFSFDMNADGINESINNYSNNVNATEILSPPAIGDIVQILPAPGSASQGLTWDGSYLWISNSVPEYIYKVNPADSSILDSFPSPGVATEGLAWDGSNLWAVANDHGGGSLDTIYQLNPVDGSVISFFEITITWAHGMTWDGTYLWVSDYETKNIFKLNPSNGQVLNSIPAPSNKGIGLTWDGTYLWTDDFVTDLLYQIDPTDGSVIRTVQLPSSNPRDLTFDGQYIWVINLLLDEVYKVDIGFGLSAEDDEVSSEEIIPSKYSLQANYPNPFNPSTVIDYSLPKRSHVTLSIYNIIGQKVKTLVDGSVSAGEHTITWNGMDDSGNQSVTGVYFYRLQTEDFTESRKMLLLK